MRHCRLVGRLAAFTQAALACVVSLGPLQAAAQSLPPRLHIVVITGEDAVNIIQLKTAVAPVVEVRDRNNQPVSGAVVNFAIRSGRATFGGARTLSVTTNTAGRAIATGFSPTGSGALQISASAAFQGQTAAAVTIAQTNVLTTAEAAAASAAGGAGGSSGGGSAGTGAGAGGGGGLSGITIGIVGAAAAAGTVYAVKEFTGGTTYRGEFSGTMLMNTPFCVRNERQTGTIEMSIEDHNGTITGTAQVDGRVALTPGTCSPDSYNTSTDTFGLDRGQVTGSPANLTLTANASNTFPPLNGSTGGVNSYDYSFTGSFEGTQITGALTITRIITNNGTSTPDRGSITYNVTLR